MASSSVSVSSAVLNQLDATLQLVETLLSSLSSREIILARRGLARAYASTALVLNGRDDVIAVHRKFGGRSEI
jgi:hypothetical protein